MTHNIDMSISKEQIDPYMMASHAKRFVVENSITKVTSDGKPHEMMTMIAGLSGLLAAVVILAVLVALVGCKGGKRNKRCKNCPVTNREPNVRKCSLDRSSTSSATSTAKVASLEAGLSAPTTPTVGGGGGGKRSSSIAIISSGNLSGNLNSAFVNSELNLTDTLSKPKKKAHFNEDAEIVIDVRSAHTKETRLDIE